MGKPVAFFCSFGHRTPGGRFSDNPRAIYQELAARDDRFRYVWHTYFPERFPDDVEAVVPGTAEYREALDNAAILVANSYWEAPLPTGNCFHVQTWHGTPLKHVFYDIPGLSEQRIAEVGPEIDQWDALISPNRFSTGALGSAFRYDGVVWETGYPRNDILMRDTGDERRNEIRRQLGIADGQRAVLYAPTWRDRVTREDGLHGATLELDVDLLSRKLGDDTVLLMRLHYLIADNFEFTSKNVRNVSGHPESSDLYLAADVLITDYSSVMFDFAVTGKPMAFFTYDLAEYRDEVRGFYFDFTATSPGPLLMSSTEVVEYLSSVESFASEYSGAYADFQKRFCHLEDGYASQRVVDRLLEAYDNGEKS